MLTDLLIVALSAAFVVSFADRWLGGGILRGVLALAVSVGGSLVFEYTGWTVAVLSTASAFLALISVLAGERMATVPPMVISRKP